MNGNAEITWTEVCRPGSSQQLIHFICPIRTSHIAHAEEQQIRKYYIVCAIKTSGDTQQDGGYGWDRFYFHDRLALPLPVDGTADPQCPQFFE